MLLSIVFALKIRTDVILQNKNTLVLIYKYKYTAYLQTLIAMNIYIIIYVNICTRRKILEPVYAIPTCHETARR